MRSDGHILGVQLGRKQRAQRAFERFNRFEDAERVGTILRAKANAVRSSSLPTSSADHTCVARGVDVRAPPQAPLDSTRPVPRPGEWVVAGVSEPNRVHTPSQPLATQPTPPLLMREAVRGFPDRLRQVCPANCSRPHARTLASGLWYACIVHTCERSYVPIHRRWRSASSSLPPPATPADQFGRRGRLRRWASKRSMHGVAGPRQRAPRLTGRSTLLAARGKRRCVPADPPVRQRRAAPECSSVPSVVPTVAFRKRLVGSPSHRLPRCKESPGPLLPMLARAILCAHACA